jgi:hypothetical protein
MKLDFAKILLEIWIAMARDCLGAALKVTPILVKENSSVIKHER